MKILSHEVLEDRQIFRTDNPGRPDFVYSLDKFNNLDEAKAEIMKSIEAEKAKKDKQEKKIKKIKDDLK